MIRARLTNGAFILGLTRENIERLQLGKPIIVSLAQLGGTDDVCIMFGETQQDIMRELERANGGELPTPKPLPKGEH
jgi:hypothetical protein